MMLGSRLKQLRLAKGYSLDRLSAATGSVVTKVALSKYERGIMNPSTRVLAALASALDTKIARLTEELTFRIDFIAYRKGTALPQKERARVENMIKTELEERVRIQHLISPSLRSDLPLQGYKVNSPEEVENAALQLREHWNLGLGPIPNLINLLEGHYIHIFMIDAHDKFDGISAVCKDSDNQPLAAALVSRTIEAGERQRFNLAHELGHLVLDISPNLDEEKMAHWFAGAFLAPKDEIVKRVGGHRLRFQIEELLLYKKHFGMSMQALMYRFKNLGVINQTVFSNWFEYITKAGFRKTEPEVLPAEESTLWDTSVFYAYSENLIGKEEAEKILKRSLGESSLSYIAKKEFMKLPKEERGKIMAEQAEKLKSYYKDISVNDDLETGDFHEY